MSYEVEQSFRNLVIFYQKELLYIDKGQKASDYFSDPQRKKLIKQGVLERIYVHRGCRLKLTNKANYVLNSYMTQQI
ncbi:hypothetical protein E4H04_06730 [Candidatus Bathyarchaeota archaeon]|nr:MAG: hypothetical protein E4H04_06730 [Candidatus Bathyarchaeota archaeon]